MYNFRETGINRFREKFKNAEFGLQNYPLTFILSIVRIFPKNPKVKFTQLLMADTRYNLRMNRFKEEKLKSIEFRSKNYQLLPFCASSKKVQNSHFPTH